MYRDSTAALDEHDRAVGAILIGETLIEECERAAKTVKRPQTSSEHERWQAVHSVSDAYPEVWRYFDRARRVLARRGANTVGYDELRPHVRRAATNSEDQRNVRDEPAIDGEALDAAKRALAELKLAVPGADWSAIAERTDGLVHAPLGAKPRRARAAVGLLIGSLVIAVLAWSLAVAPVHRPNPRAVMRQELGNVAMARKQNIMFLQAELGDRCDVDVARDLVQALVQDGRGGDAKQLGESYLGRCGYDRSIDHWSHAPLPGR